jgi:hypothetical protein
LHRAISISVGVLPQRFVSRREQIGKLKGRSNHHPNSKF